MFLKFVSNFHEPLYLIKLCRNNNVSGCLEYSWMILENTLISNPKESDIRLEFNYHFNSKFFGSFQPWRLCLIHLTPAAWICWGWCCGFHLIITISHWPSSCILLHWFFAYKTKISLEIQSWNMFLRVRLKW